MVVVKPFIGFVKFNRLHPPAKIDGLALQRAFGKRIFQYRDGSLNPMASVQKRLGTPQNRLLVTFLSALLLLFSVLPTFGYYILLYLKKQRVPHPLPTYLVNRRLIV